LEETVSHFIDTNNIHNCLKINEELQKKYILFLLELEHCINQKQYYKAGYIYNCLLFIKNIQSKINTFHSSLYK
jgi:hypothetical protein